MKRILLAVLAAVVMTSGAHAQSALSRDSKLHTAFERFISDAYLQDWFAAPETIRRHYAPRMSNYWGRKGVQQDRVLSEKLAYASRWPDRQFRLLPNSLFVVPGAGGLYNVTFNYEYNVRGPGRRSAGVGETTLRVLLDDPRVVIFAEGGRVLKRY